MICLNIDFIVTVLTHIYELVCIYVDVLTKLMNWVQLVVCIDTIIFIIDILKRILGYYKKVYVLKSTNYCVIMAITEQNQSNTYHVNKKIP